MKLVLSLLFALAGIKSSVGTAFGLTIWKMEAKHLPKTDKFGLDLGDPYVIIKQQKDGRTNQLHRTSYRSHTTNPVWLLDGTPADSIDNRDIELIFEVWDKDHFDSEFYGTYTMKTKEAVDACGRKINPATSSGCTTQGTLAGGYGQGLLKTSFRITEIFGNNNRQDCGGNGANQTTCGSESDNQIKLSYQISGVLTLCYLLSTLQLKLNY